MSEFKALAIPVYDQELEKTLKGTKVLQATVRLPHFDLLYSIKLSFFVPKEDNPSLSCVASCWNVVHEFDFLPLSYCPSLAPAKALFSPRTNQAYELKLFMTYNLEIPRDYRR